MIPNLQTGSSVKVPRWEICGQFGKWPTFPVLHAGVKQKNLLESTIAWPVPANKG